MTDDASLSHHNLHPSRSFCPPPLVFAPHKLWRPSRHTPLRVRNLSNRHPPRTIPGVDGCEHAQSRCLLQGRFSQGNKHGLAQGGGFVQSGGFVQGSGRMVEGWWWNRGGIVFGGHSGRFIMAHNAVDVLCTIRRLRLCIQRCYTAHAYNYSIRGLAQTPTSTCALRAKPCCTFSPFLRPEAMHPKILASTWLQRACKRWS